MDTLIFRNDDISANTNYIELFRCYKVIKDIFPKCEIISGITLFSKSNKEGSVYPGVPFKNRPLDWFFNVDSFVDDIDIIQFGRIASHGLFHVKHSELPVEAQKMSIISSCRFLSTQIFIPPFNNWNIETVKICDEYGLNLISAKGLWKNFEYEQFDSKHPFWNFHSWRWTPDKLRTVLKNEKHSKSNG